MEPKEVKDTNKLSYDALLSELINSGLNWDSIQQLNYEEIYDLFPTKSKLHSPIMQVIIRELDKLDAMTCKELALTDPFTPLNEVLLSQLDNRIKLELSSLNFTFQRRALTMFKEREFEFLQPMDASSMYLYHYFKYSRLSSKSQFYHDIANKSLKERGVLVQQNYWRNKIKYIILYLVTSAVVILTNLGDIFNGTINVIAYSLIFFIIVLTIYINMNESKSENTNVIRFNREGLLLNKLIFINILMKADYS